MKAVALEAIKDGYMEKDCGGQKYCTKGKRYPIDSEDCGSYRIKSQGGCDHFFNKDDPTTIEHFRVVYEMYEQEKNSLVTMKENVRERETAEISRQSVTLHNSPKGNFVKINAINESILLHNVYVGHYGATIKLPAPLFKDGDTVTIDYYYEKKKPETRCPDITVADILKL